jgi:hydroxyethylthiazole kinase-like sugar kinase family protein
MDQSSNSSVSILGDTTARIISAVVILAALYLIWELTSKAVDIAPKDPKSHLPAITDVVTMVTGIGGLVVSIVGLFFGVNVARQGLDAASQANKTANNLAGAYQSQQTQNSTFRATMAGGLAALKSQVPEHSHAAIDNLLAKVQN